MGLHGLLDRMLDLDPTQRPSWLEVAQHAFVGVESLFRALERRVCADLPAMFDGLRAPLPPVLYASRTVPALEQLVGFAVKHPPTHWVVLAMAVPLVEVWTNGPLDAVSESIAESAYAAGVGTCAASVCCRYLGLHVMLDADRPTELGIAQAVETESRMLQDVHVAPLPVFAQHNPVMEALRVRPSEHELVGPDGVRLHDSAYARLLCVLYLDIRLASLGMLAPTPPVLWGAVVEWLRSPVDYVAHTRPTFEPLWRRDRRDALSSCSLKLLQCIAAPPSMAAPPREAVAAV